MTKKKMVNTLISKILMILLCGSTGRLASAASSPVALLVTTRYRNQRDLDPEPCGQCAIFDNDSNVTDIRDPNYKTPCFRNRAVIPEEVCMKSGNHFRKFTFVESENVSKEVLYDDADCTVESAEGGVTALTTDNICDDSSSLVHSRLADFCIFDTDGSGPTADFRVPLLPVFQYETQELCQSDGEGFTGWVFDDPGLCMQRNRNREIPAAATTTFCTENGDLEMHRNFPSSLCEESTLNTGGNWTSDVVQAGRSSCSLFSSVLPFATVLDCQTPPVYCKDLADTEFAYSIRPSTSTPSDAPQTQSPTGIPDEEGTSGSANAPSQTRTLPHLYLALAFFWALL